MNHTAISSMVI